MSEDKKIIKTWPRAGRPLIWTEEKIEDLCDELAEWIETSHNIYLGDFYRTKMAEETWMRILAKSDRLRHFRDLAIQKQKSFLINGMLADKVPYRPAQLMLSHYHGMSPVNKEEEKSTVINVYSKKFSCSLDKNFDDEDSDDVE